VSWRTALARRGRFYLFDENCAGTRKMTKLISPRNIVLLTQIVAPLAFVALFLFTPAPV
jgi:hypothetical protein